MISTIFPPLIVRGQGLGWEAFTEVQRLVTISACILRVLAFISLVRD